MVELTEVTNVEDLIRRDGFSVYGGLPSPLS